MAKSDWIKRAACRGMDTNIFFPQAGGSLVEAKKVCATCTVRRECLAWALHDPDIRVGGGVFGGEGMTARRRHKAAFLEELAS